MFVMEAAMGGMMEVETGNIAQQNAASQRVKDFGTMMVTDHGNANSQLSTLAASHGLTLPASLPADKQKQVNALLYTTERKLLQEKKLPRRPWYRHQVYAPGYYTGYGVKTLPGIREGIEEKHWKETQENIEIVAKTLQGYIQQIQAANALLK